MLQVILIALKRLFLGVKPEPELPPLSYYTLNQTGKRNIPIRRIGSGNTEYLLRLSLAASVILLLLGIAVRSTLNGRAEVSLPTATLTATAMNSPTPELSSPTATPNLEIVITPEAPGWSPNQEDAQHYQQQCTAANGIMEERMHEVVVGQVSFLPDYSAADVAASCNYVRYGTNQPQGVIIHYTSGSLAASLSWFRKLDGTSAHYLIDRDGTVYQLIPEEVGAVHVTCAGNSCLPTCPYDLCGDDGYPELRTIGIELVNWGYVDPAETGILVYEDYLASFGRRYWEDFSEIQLIVLKDLVCDIARRWSIPVDSEHIVGHYRINQKLDPGPALNLFWERLGLPLREPLFANGCD
ncbi:MAG: N-acetylmuramoyl-L-alanine amidase [Anaerolineae bacterium]|nr:MAG: N-acetylmuramoyl-L-alanine amidase [Anaerolineae bacterium]